MGKRGDIVEVLRAALPVMLAYLAIGIPCGVMEAKVGFTPLMAFLFSATYYSGAGQFMLPGMVMAGSPAAAIVGSISLVNTRQILYSAAFAPYAGEGGTLTSLLFAATVTDESFGINLDRFSKDGGWSMGRGLALNLLCLVSWAVANMAGALLGPVLNIPTDVLSFAMTAIFICLLVGQPINSQTVTVMVVTALAVAACKLVGLSGAAIFVGAVAGIVGGMARGSERRAEGDRGGEKR